MARPKLPSHLRRNFPLRIGLTNDEDTRLWRAAEASGLTREAYVRSLLWPGADVLRIARPLLPSEGQEREMVLFADAALKAEVTRGARKCRMLPLDFLRAVIEGAVVSASPSLHHLVERVVSSLRETDRRLADEVEAHLVASPKLVEPDSEHVAQVEECLAVALASSPWADRSKDTVNPAGMPPSWVAHARFLLREKAPPSSPPIPQADLRGPDRKPRPLSDEPLTEPIRHQWPALGGRPLIAGPIQPPAPPPLDPPGTVYPDADKPAAILTLDTPPPDTVSLSTSGRVEVRHLLPTPTAENIADKVRALRAEFANQRYPLAPGMRPTDDVEPAPDTRVQEVQAVLDAVAEPLPAAAPVAAPTPCPKCNGAGRIGVPPVRFRCPVCAGSGKASLDNSAKH